MKCPQWVWISVVVIVTGLAVVGCQEKPEPVEKITIAAYRGPDNAPIYVASVKGHFKDEGLDVTLQPYASGKACLNAVLEGKADLATVAETPIMHSGLRGDAIYIIATLLESGKGHSIVARKDRGIIAPSDLEDKKIGVPLGTSAEFLLNAFLIYHRILRGDVDIVNVPPEEILNALVQGEVDAVSTWQPVTTTLQKELGDNAIEFTGEGIYSWTWNITARQDFVNRHPGTIKEVLRALIKGVQFIHRNPDESRNIIVDYTEMDRALLIELWDIFDFELTLEQSLLVTLEDEARWAIRNKLTSATEVPDYLDYIYLDALAEVKPEAVTIIR